MSVVDARKYMESTSTVDRAKIRIVKNIPQLVFCRLKTLIFGHKKCAVCLQLCHAGSNRCVSACLLYQLTQTLHTLCEDDWCDDTMGCWILDTWIHSQSPLILVDREFGLMLVLRAIFRDLAPPVPRGRSERVHSKKHNQQSANKYDRSRYHIEMGQI